MAEILVHVNHQDYSHVDTEKDEGGVYKRGYIVDIRAGVQKKAYQDL